MVRVLSKSKSRLGECPVWDERSERVFWVDIEAGRLFAATLDGAETIWDLPERIGSFGLTTTTHVVVMALASGFALYDLERRALDRIPMRHDLGESVRFNDGKCDPNGNFWAGAMSEKDPRQPDAHLYRLRPDLTIDVMLDGIRVSNSLAWSSDGARLFFADSPTRTILSWASPEANAMLGPAEIFAGPEVFRGVPDGSTIDADNRLWTAEWDGWRLLVHDRRGRLTKEIPLPVRRPTSCCFGGPDLDILFVTTATDDDPADAPDRHSCAGHVLVIDGAGKGRPTDRFTLDRGTWTPS